MLKKLWQGLQSLLPHIKTTQTLSWLRDFMITVPYIGSCLALLSLVTEEPVVVYLSAASLIMYLTVGLGYLLIMMRTFGWQVQVEASVDIGEISVAMGYLLLTAVSLLVAYHSCMW